MVESPKEHENWIRFHLVENLLKHHKHHKIERIIEDAAKLTGFVLSIPSCEIKSICSENSVDKRND